MKSSASASENLRLVAQAVDCDITCGAARDNQYEFATPAEAVQGRLRIGIQCGFIRSLVADALSPIEAARELAAFCRTKAVKGKFFPTFTIQPNTFFADRALEAWMEVVRQNPARLFALPLEGREDRLRLALRFLAELGKGNPSIVLIRVTEAPPLNTLIAAALQNPQIRFVLTNVAWDSESYVHAAMQEAENILTDTSLSHASDRTEIFCERYGAHRILFSLGHRAVGGAALGAILHAKIPTREKEDILFGNITKLLDLPASKLPASPKLAPGEWKNYLEHGHPEHPVIDAHGHFGPVAGWAVREQDESIQIQNKCARMAAQHLRYFVFSHARALFAHPAEGNAIAEKQVLAAKDPRLLAYFVYNPRYASALDPYLARVPRSKVFIGFKTLCDYWKVRADDARFDPMWRVADEFHLPVLIHTWAGMHDSPAMLDPIARRFPNARLLLAHCGGSDAGRVEAEQLAREHRNVYLEWCGSFFTHKPWETTVRELGSHKLIFGTDGVLHDHDWELARLLSAPLDDEDFRRILHDTFGGIISPLLATCDLDSIFT